MSLILRFYNPANGLLIGDVPTEKCSISLGLGQSGEWSTTLSANLEVTQYLEKGYDVEIYYQGRMFLRGSIQDFDTKLEDTSTVSLKGRDILDTLYDHRGYSKALFKDVPLLQALHELLDQAGWAIGDISTLPDALTQKVTRDLRAERQLLPQIAKLIEGFPRIGYRYGGMVAGKHTLDVGYFSRPSGLYFFSPPNDDTVLNETDGLIEDTDRVGFIKSLSYKTTLEEVIYGLEAWGGEVTDNNGVKRQISLYDAVQNDPTLPTHPQYPVIEQLYKQTYFMFDRERCPYPGGKFENFDAGAAAYANCHVGNPHGTANWLYSQAVWFYPMPGRLREVVIDSHTVAGSGSISDDLVFWIHEAGAYPTPGAELYKGLLNPGSSDIQTGQRFRHYVPEGTDIILEPGREYVLVLGLDRTSDIASVSTFRRMRANTGSNMLTTRAAVKTTYAGSWTATDTHSLAFTLITDPINLPQGGTTTETNREIAPAKTETNATDANIKAAGHQLWLWGQAFLQDHEANRTTYDLTVLGDTVLPNLGDTVYIRGQAEGTVVDPYTGDSESRTVTVEGDFRVDKIKLDFADDSVDVSMSLTDGVGITNLDQWVNIYDEAKQTEPPQGDVIAGLVPATTTTSSVSVDASDPDTTLSDGRPAKLVTIPYPTSDAPSLMYNKAVLASTPIGTSPRGDVTVEIVNRPDPTTQDDWQVKVCVGQRWIYGDTAELDFMYIWY